ncbi:MAG: hypothetical protein ACLQU1_18620 [Bryobacteraceae bacterium]
MDHTKSADRRVLVLRPAKWKSIACLVGSLAFAAFGARVAVSNGGIVVWLCVSFFALCSAVFLVQLIPGSSYLRLTAEGFDVCTMFRKWPRILWSSASNFRAVSIPPSFTRLVVFDLDEPARRTLSRLNRGLAGADAGLPDTYGMSAQDLASLMNAWRSGGIPSS